MSGYIVPMMVCLLCWLVGHLSARYTARLYYRQRIKMRAAQLKSLAKSYPNGQAALVRIAQWMEVDP
jgi:hypothetical protein